MSININHTDGSIRITNEVLKLSANGYLTIPKGSTAERPIGVKGAIRYNTDTNTFEFFSTEWNRVLVSGDVSPQKNIVGSGDIEVSSSPNEYVISANTGIITATNTGGISLINSVGKTLSLKGLTAGGNIELTDNGTSIKISAITTSGGSGGNSVFEISTQVFTSVGTYNITVPSGFNACEVTVVGGGGAGGGVSNNSSVKGHAGGGGSGALCFAYISGFPLGTNITVVVGSAGTSLSYTTQAESGGDSKFYPYVVCSGGHGGFALDQVTSELMRFTTQRATFITSGVEWFYGVDGETGNPAYASGHPFLANFTNLLIPLVLDKGGGSVPGFGRGASMQVVSGNNVGLTGQGYGAGGGGATRITASNRYGGSGQPGIVIVRWLKV